MATSPQNFAPSLIFTQSEATAGQATWSFRAVNSADSTNATGKTFTMTIGKAGGALAAPNAGTAITEVALGWYKVVHNAADFDTLGELRVHLTATGVDIIATAHQIIALDLNVATVNPATGGIVAASFGAGAIDAAAIADNALDAATFAADATVALNTPVVSIVKTFDITADGDYAISMKDAVDATVELTGTFASASGQVQTTEDPTVTTPTWTNRGSAITSSNAATPLVVAGPHNAIRLHVTSSTGSTVMALKITIRKPPGT